MRDEIPKLVASDEEGALQLTQLVDKVSPDRLFDVIELVFAAIRKDENEACAKIVEKLSGSLARAIRERVKR